MRKIFAQIQEGATNQGKGTLAVCGDPVAGRALVLLLRGADYDVKFLPLSVLEEPGMLEGVQLLILGLTPGLNEEGRGALLKFLRSSPFAASMPTLELVVPEGAQNAEPRDSRLVVPWPCSTEQLKERIETALRTRL
ncbi:MAG TPA: hypothetical protein VFJ72_12490 [Rubrobacteraceae bacterium]|nr:hypothetical protein [Rubrobacteraceae bacterium]